MTLKVKIMTTWNYDKVIIMTQKVEIDILSQNDDVLSHNYEIKFKLWQEIILMR